jgi:hypothetical protein
LEAVMDSLVHLMQTIVLCITVLIVACMVLVVVVLRMESNPLREILTSLLWRLGATTGLAVVGVPLQPVPAVDVTYDLGGSIILFLYWLGFFRDVYLAMGGNRKNMR